jgi:UDP-3-O-[3-hydroxymyristoyl] glucosamine N-acyltransferase
LALRSDERSAGKATTLGALAELVGGALEGDVAAQVMGVAGLEDAGSTEVSFCGLPQYRQLLATTAAGCVVVGTDFDLPSGTRADLPLIRVANPYAAVARIVNHFYPLEATVAGAHATAIIDPSAQVDESAAIGAGVVIGAGCAVGARSRVDAGCVLSPGARIGVDCILYPNVTLYSAVDIGDRVILHAGVVLGADGFGYVFEDGHHLKIPQVGRVVIEEDVEIGANTCIDRAAMGVTRVARGTKIDNLVQIGHNCDVGADSVLSGQVGLGGSTIVGKGVMVGGQAGLKGHIKVGDGVMIAGGSGVTSSVADGQVVAGFPNMDAKRWRRAMAAVKDLPEVIRRVRKLERTQNAEKEDE